MELIERYVRAVGERLHPSRRKGVEAELRSSILDALEARNAGPDSEDDVVAVLLELGDPASVAAEYEPSRRYLIGPDLYPLFRRAVRVVLVTLAVASAFGFVASLLVGGLADFRAGELLVDALGLALRAAVVAMAVLVAVFVWLERREIRLPRRMLPQGGGWDPRSLPSRRTADRVPRSEAVVGLLATAVVLVIVGGIGQVAREAGPHVAAPLRPLIERDVVGNVWLLQMALVVSALAYAFALVQGRWRSYTRAMRLIADVIGVFVFTRLAFQLREYRSALIDAGGSRNFVDWLIANALITAAIVVVVVVFSWWRLWRRARVGEAGRLHGAAAFAVLAPLLAPLLTTWPGAGPMPAGRAIISAAVHEDGLTAYRHRAPGADPVVLAWPGKPPATMVAETRGVWSHATSPAQVS